MVICAGAASGAGVGAALGAGAGAVPLDGSALGATAASAGAAGAGLTTFASDEREPNATKPTPPSTATTATTAPITGHGDLRPGITPLAVGCPCPNVTRPPEASSGEVWLASVVRWT